MNRNGDSTLCFPKDEINGECEKWNVSWKMLTHVEIEQLRPPPSCLIQFFITSSVHGSEVGLK